MGDICTADAMVARSRATVSVSLMSVVDPSTLRQHCVHTGAVEAMRTLTRGRTTRLQHAHIPIPFIVDKRKGLLCLFSDFSTGHLVGK